MPKAAGSVYGQRVNRVIDHIDAHLGDELTLGGLAGIAAFSPFHFSRVFKALTGETLFAFIQRVRLEKAAVALGNQRDASVLAIALDHGFASAATFARAFKTHFGMSATAWRAGELDRRRTAYARSRKPGPRPRKPGKHLRKRSKASRRGRAHTRGMTNVQIREMPVQHVAYMRHVGPYGPGGIPELWVRFRKWMTSRDLIRHVRLGIAHDDPSVTDPAKCRYDACVVVPPDFTPDRHVNVMDVPGGKYAMAPFEGTPRDIEGAWHDLFAAWLPSSGFEPDDRACFELYRGHPEVEGQPGAFRCEIYLPVRPLS
jgi:AraC family transcriptional regulator